MSKHIFLFFCFCTSLSWGQSQGPNNSNTQANIALTGIISWTSPGSAKTSDNSYATVTDGLSTYLSSTNYGFSIPSGNTIKGIMVEVERHGLPQSVVAAGAWPAPFSEPAYPSTGTPTATATYGTTNYSYSVPTGSMRLLVVAIGIENVDHSVPQDNSITLGAVTYGGKALTLAGTATLSSTDGITSNTVAIYYLKEADFPLIAGSHTLSITKTFNGEASGESINAGEYVEIVDVNTYTNVDQTNTISAVTKTNTGTSITSPALTDIRKGDYIVAGTMNNNTGTGVNVTGSGSYNTQLFDLSDGNTSSTTSGAIFHGQGAVVTATGTPSVTVSANGAGASRLEMVAIAIHSARVYDNSVQLIKGGLIVGSDYAVSTESLPNAWPDADVVQTYGGSTDLWGTTWTLAEINATNFGVAFKADADNSIGSVDQIRITVYYDVSLAVTLQSFVLEENEDKVVASLSYNTDDHKEYTFTLERAGSDLQFSPVNSVIITGNYAIQNLSIADLEPDADFPYYRIKIVEQDKVSSPTYSSIQNVKLNLSTQIQLYPNPATSYLEINSNNLIHSVSFLDITGKTVAVQQTESGVKSLTIETLPAKGLYTILINTDSGITVKKIVID